MADKKDIDNIELCIVKMEGRIKNNSGSITLPKDAFPLLPDKCKFIFLRKGNSNYLSVYPTIDLNTVIYELYVEVEYGTLGSFVRQFTQLIKDEPHFKFIPELSQGCPGKKGEPCIFHGFLLGEKGYDSNTFKSNLHNIRVNDKKIIHDYKLTIIN